MNLKSLIDLNTKYKIQSSTFSQLFQGSTQEEKDKKNVIIYLPEPEALSGIGFVDLYRKKGIIGNVLSFPIYSFFNRKYNAKDYIRDFRLKNPGIQLLSNIKNKRSDKKVDVIDLTILSKLFYSLSGTQSKFKLTLELIKYINTLLKENDISLKTDNVYLFYNGTSESPNLFINLVYKLFMKNGMRFPVKDFEVTSIIGFHSFTEKDKKFQELYALTKIDPKDKNKEITEKKHLLKIGTFNSYKKEVLDLPNDELNVDETTPLDSEGNKTIQHKEDLKTKIEGIVEKTEDSSNNKLSEDITNQTGKEDIHNLDDKSLDDVYIYINSLLEYPEYKEKFKEANEDISKFIEMVFKDDKKFIKKVQKFSSFLDEINSKYNGKIKLNRNNVNKLSDMYYDPIDILGRDDLNVYNKQKTEFGEVLDEAMFDLIKSIEKDKEAGLRVESIKTEIIDTNKDRLKVYKIKIKNIKNPSQRTYTKEIYLPYPVKDKYIKIGGNSYIMINQFYAKPILKVKPNLVRLYTHFNTTACSLNTHKINSKEDMKDYIKSFYKTLGKKIKEMDYQDPEKLSSTLAKYDINPVRILSNHKIKIEG